ncbi:hypothetical protein [Saccharopolyspora sp. NPDC049426]
MRRAPEEILVGTTKYQVCQASLDDLAGTVGLLVDDVLAREGFKMHL